MPTTELQRSEGADLSLYEIQYELLDAVARVDDLQRQIETLRAIPAEEQALYGIDLYREELASLEGDLVNAEAALREYVKAEAKKVDGVAGFIRWCEGNVAVARAERDRLAERVRAWERREERVKRTVLEVMRAFGVTRYETPLNVLRVQNNGGVPTPVIEDVAALPGHLVRAVITTTLEHSEVMRKAVPGSAIQKLETEPMNGAIAKALKAGPVPGAREGERGQHLRVG